MYASIYKQVVGDEFNPHNPNRAPASRTKLPDDSAFETYKEVWNKYQDKRDHRF